MNNAKYSLGNGGRGVEVPPVCDGVVHGEDVVRGIGPHKTAKNGVISAGPF